jgi:thiamine-monophosphate kinase
MKVSSVGEFGLIDRLAALLGPREAGSLLMGIGDDAAVWRPTPGCLTVATADSLVEAVHFDLRTTSWSDLGWKALAENVSDIAAMGCSPRYALIGLGVPAETHIDDLEALYAGLAECGKAFGCRIVGGDTVRSSQVVIHVTVIGESEVAEGDDRPILTRSAAVPGDLVAVTGPLGASAAGLRLLQAGASLERDDEELVKSHRRPLPRVGAGLRLVEAGVRCGIDISDGLLADLGHICERSGVYARIEAAQVPVHRAATARFGVAAIELALSGGEDYELVCAGSRDALAAASARLVDDGEPPLVVIGSIIERSEESPMILVIDGEGHPIELPETGYRHFGSDI